MSTRPTRNRPRRACVVCGINTQASLPICLPCQRAGHVEPDVPLVGGRWVRKGLVQVWEAA